MRTAELQRQFDARHAENLVSQLAHAKETSGGASPGQGSPTDAYKAAHARGQEVGAKAERERIRAILTCAEAHARPTLARQLALDDGVSLETARKILAHAAKESTGSEFAAAMAAIGNPNVGVDGDRSQIGVQRMTFAETIFANRKRDVEIARGAATGGAEAAGHG
mgnify:FL=1